MSTPPPDVRIEPAVLSDLDRLVELWVELARGQRAYDSHLLPEPNRTPVRETLARHVVVGGVLVARSGDELVGFVTFGVERGDYEQAVTRGTVHHLFVVSQWRGRGLGGALLGRAETALADAGADVVSLEVMAANRRARRFYDRHDYRLHRVELEKSVQSDTHSKEDG